MMIQDYAVPGRQPHNTPGEVRWTPLRVTGPARALAAAARDADAGERDQGRRPPAPRCEMPRSHRHGQGPRRRPAGLALAPGSGPSPSARLAGVGRKAAGVRSWQP